MKFLNESISSMPENRTTTEIMSLFREMKAEEIRMNLKKLWLEDFYSYVGTLNNTTKEMMYELLEMEADFISVQIVYNSLYNKDLANVENQMKVRKKLIPNFGKLYPDCHKALIETESIEKHREVV